MYNEGFDQTYADGSGIGLIAWLVIFGLYFYLAFTQYKMAQKCDCDNEAWWSFIPILNTFLLIKMAGKEWWWFVLFLVPVVNLVAFFMAWIEVAKNVGHSPVWGFLVMLPFFNFVALYVLAFTNGKQSYDYPNPPAQPQEDRTPTHVG